MKLRRSIRITGITLVAFLASALAVSTQDRYSVKIPGGLSFAEFKGFDTWQTIAVSHNGNVLAVILGNPAMIPAYRQGIPKNGKPFPDGAKMAKIHWVAKVNVAQPGQPIQPGELQDIDFMAKDSKRFAGTGGWGYGAFEYNAADDTFRAGNASDNPPQGNDAQCGAACHTLARQNDFVFTEFAKR